MLEFKKCWMTSIAALMLLLKNAHQAMLVKKWPGTASSLKTEITSSQAVAAMWNTGFLKTVGASIQLSCDRDAAKLESPVAPTTCAKGLVDGGDGFLATDITNGGALGDGINAPYNWNYTCPDGERPFHNMTVTGDYHRAVADRMHGAPGRVSVLYG